MRPLTSKDGDLLSHFAKFVECWAQIQNTSFIHLLIFNYDEAANKGKVKRQLLLELSLVDLV